MENNENNPFTELEWSKGWITKKDAERVLMYSDSHIRKLQRDHQLRKALYKKVGDDRANVCYNLQDIYNFAIIRHGKWMGLLEKVIPVEKTFTNEEEEEEKEKAVLSTYSQPLPIQTKEFEDFLKKIVGEVLDEKLASFKWPELPQLPAPEVVEVASSRRMTKWELVPVVLLAVAAFGMVSYMLSTWPA